MKTTTIMIIVAKVITIIKVAILVKLIDNHKNNDDEQKHVHVYSHINILYTTFNT